MPPGLETSAASCGAHLKLRKVIVPVAPPVPPAAPTCALQAFSLGSTYPLVWAAPNQHGLPVQMMEHQATLQSCAPSCQRTAGKQLACGTRAAGALISSACSESMSPSWQEIPGL